MAVVESVRDVSSVIINLTPSYIAGTESVISKLLSSSNPSVCVFFKTCQACNTCQVQFVGVVITLLIVISIKESTCMP